MKARHTYYASAEGADQGMVVFERGKLVEANTGDLTGKRHWGWRKHGGGGSGAAVELIFQDRRVPNLRHRSTLHPAYSINIINSRVMMDQVFFSSSPESSGHVRV
jgi:hypothetical protein